jgi:hypothetical protein
MQGGPYPAGRFADQLGKKVDVRFAPCVAVSTIQCRFAAIMCFIFSELYILGSLKIMLISGDSCKFV